MQDTGRPRKHQIRLFRAHEVSAADAFLFCTYLGMLYHYRETDTLKLCAEHRFTLHDQS